MRCTKIAGFFNNLLTLFECISKGEIFQKNSNLLGGVLYFFCESSYSKLLKGVDTKGKALRFCKALISLFLVEGVVVVIIVSLQRI